MERVHRSLRNNSIDDIRGNMAVTRSNNVVVGVVRTLPHPQSDRYNCLRRERRTARYVHNAAVAVSTGPVFCIFLNS